MIRVVDDRRRGVKTVSAVSKQAVVRKRESKLTCSCDERSLTPTRRTHHHREDSSHLRNLVSTGIHTPVPPIQHDVLLRTPLDSLWYDYRNRVNDWSHPISGHSLCSGWPFRETCGGHELGRATSRGHPPGTRMSPAAFRAGPIDHGRRSSQGHAPFRRLSVADGDSPSRRP